MRAIPSVLIRAAAVSVALGIVAAASAPPAAADELLYFSAHRSEPITGTVGDTFSWEPFVAPEALTTLWRTMYGDGYVMLQLDGIVNDIFGPPVTDPFGTTLTRGSTYLTSGTWEMTLWDEASRSGRTVGQGVFSLEAEYYGAAGFGQAPWGALSGSLEPAPFITAFKSTPKAPVYDMGFALNGLYDFDNGTSSFMLSEPETAATAVVPEPASMIALGVGLGLLGVRRGLRHMRRSARPDA